MKSEKVALSETMPNGPERKFLEAVNKNCDDHPELSYYDAFKLTLSEMSELERRDLERARRMC